MRLFIAIEFPEAVKAAMACAQEDLRSRMPPKCLSLGTPGQFHLTLKFLGEVDSARVETLKSGLVKAVSPFGPLSVRVAGAGCFPNARRPRVTWLGVEDQDRKLPDLHLAIQRATEDFADAEPENRFHAHATIARVKQLPYRAADVIERWMKEWEGKVFGSWTAGEAVLMESRLSPNGAKHSVLASLPFQQALD